MAKGIGYGQQRLINKIVENTWGTSNPKDVKFSINDVLYIIQEIQNEEGKAHLEDRTMKSESFKIFKQFVEHILYRNLANYDSMLLLTSDKGYGKCMYIRDGRDFVISVDGDLKHPKNTDYVVMMDENMKLKTVKVKKKYNRPEKDVYQLNLRSGKNICLTKEHPLYTVNGWTPLKDINEKEFVATPRKYELNNNKTINIGLIKILAYLIADGYTGGCKVEFAKKDDYIIEDFKKSLHEYDENLYFNNPRIATKLERQFKENGDFKEMNSLKKYLEECGLYNKRSDEKFIPSDILKSNNKSIALFLNRLFSCNGCVEYGESKKRREISYTSKSEVLIKQLQHLLLRFGVKSRYKSKFKRSTNSKTHYGSTYYQLSISGKDDMNKFYNEIGFFHDEKRKKLKVLCDDISDLKTNTNVDVVPSGVLKNYKFQHGNLDYKELFNIANFRREQFRNNNNSLKRFKMFAELEDDKDLLKYSESDIFWDRVESVEKINNVDDVTVYDLEVDDVNHNFVANDIIIHNSSAAIMIARLWCKLIGIRFKPERHLAYSNRDVMEKIDQLKPFEPLVADESVRFASTSDWNKKESKELRKKLAEVRTKHLLFILCFPLKIEKMEKTYLDCVSGDTIVKTDKGDFKIRELEGCYDFKVLSYNETTKEYEYRKAEGCKFVKYDYAYNIRIGNNNVIASLNHEFYTRDGWKRTSELTISDSLFIDNEFVKIGQISYYGKEKLYDILNVENNHNYVANYILISNSFVNYWCLSSDTKIKTQDIYGMIRNTPIKDLNKKNSKVLTYNEKTGEYEFKKYEKKVKTKKNAEVYELELENGLKIKCTEDHPFMTQRGWVRLKDLNDDDKVQVKTKYMLVNIKSIKKLDEKEDVYDIVGVEDNHNFVANDMVVHNCDLFARGFGAIYVKDKNPANDAWRLKDFKNVGSYTEFTSVEDIKKKLKKHPNFWQLIKFPKPPKWLYKKYAKIRDDNVYNEESNREMVTTEDIHKSLLLMALQDIMMNDTTLSMNRIMLHIKNTYDIPITKKSIQTVMNDAKQLVTKIKEEQV